MKVWRKSKFGEISEIGGKQSADPNAKQRDVQIGKFGEPYDQNGSQIRENPKYRDLVYALDFQDMDVA